MKGRLTFLGAAFITVVIMLQTGAVHAQQTGVTEGVLTAKGETWIAVQADGVHESTKLVPCWIGGLPQNGGGLDKRMLALFQQLVVGSRLKVAWVRGEHLCVTAIQVLSLPGQDGTTTDDNSSAQQEKPPAQKAGSFVGVVTGKGESWIAIRPDGEHESQKFIPRWVGGAPNQGGGFDKDALRAIAEIAVGSHVSVTWIWDEHYRLTGLKPAAQ
jgi:hypothetical protein